MSRSKPLLAKVNAITDIDDGIWIQQIHFVATIAEQKEFHRFFPRLVFTIRDFELTPKVKGLDRIATANEYMDDCLTAQDMADLDPEDKSGLEDNMTKTKLTQFFKNRQCFLLKHPAKVCVNCNVSFIPIDIYDCFFRIRKTVPFLDKWQKKISVQNSSRLRMNSKSTFSTILESK